MRTYKLTITYEGEKRTFKAITDDFGKHLANHKCNESAELTAEDSDACGMWFLYFFGEDSSCCDVELRASNRRKSDQPKNIDVVVWDKGGEFWIDANDYTLTIK